MDYSSESELIESLDYLTLPVKRSSSIGKGSGFCEKNKTRYLRDFRNKVSHKTQTSHSLHRCNDSIILNSTKKEIVQYYTVLSETSSDKYLKILQSEERNNHKKPKSLIKVTVTPKKPKPQKLNIFSRRNQSSKQLHNTVSEEDRSNKAKHMCLVVTGRKRERQYNIKTTESARLLNDIRKVNDDISLDQVKSVKHLIESLNMDKKRKKAPATKRPASPTKPKGNATKTEKNIEVSDGQNMVRITGQIGLGQDNQLMVRCGVEGTKAPKSIEMKEYHPSSFGEHIAGTLLHTVTQGTQMDISVVDSAPHKSIPLYPNNMTCFCNNVNEFETSPNDHSAVKKCQSPLVVITVYPNDERCENVKIFKNHNRCRTTLDEMYGSLTNLNCMPQSTRFNNQYQEDKECVDKIKKESGEDRKRRPRSASRSGKGKKAETKYKRGSSRPRSGSRSTNSSSSQNVKGQRPKTTENATRPKSPRNLSPSKNTAQNSKPKETENRQMRAKTQSPDTKNQNVKRQDEGNKNISSKNKKEEKYMKSPTLSRSPSPSGSSNHNVKRQIIENKKNKKHESRQQGLQRKEKETKSHLTSTATNTDHVLTKKALVDSFTKEIMGQMGKHNKKDKCKTPQFTESQLQINIEGDNENYDVFLQQGRMTTDVRVKKTSKYPSEQRNTERYQCQAFPDPAYIMEEKSKSLLNMIDMDDFRETYESHGLTNANDILEMPEMKVRDSLEIGHKRKDRSPRNTREEDFERDFENHLREQAGASAARDSFAPIKHYRGDKCLIPDPVKRDKEVRQLLGLEATRNDCCPCPYQMPHHHRKNDESERLCELFYANDNYRSRKTKDALRNTAQINRINYHKKTIKQTTGTQYEAPNYSLDSSLSKKSTLNRNIQVLLEVQKFTEEKPIILSRKQYHKVKKAIEHTISKHRPKSRLAKAKCSIMNIETKKKNVKYIDQNIGEKRSHINIFSTKSKEVFASNETAVLFTKAFIRSKAQAKQEEPVKHHISITDLRRSFLEPWNESSTKVAVGSSYSHSIHTLFKGLKKPRTPNFGTSACSFFSNSINEYQECDSVKNFKSQLDKPIRKPFLKRLISCLILRASTASEVKLSAMPRRMSSNNSSIDSYHISTSLGAIEMSSSIYDTSESFYSNHSIMPINSKIKKERGFFGSMRGLLTGKN
ncbi:uncharacterized protein LOC128679456 [Plodia interpunctella]|uniref:uncharacterized protein LOC128679456 n=1 Tax=Plodia interpunctella TaxID=58824 RepID=UPI00236815C7|nr:uncharacterized protein LOC128679456 [Plodia interpunctella]